MLLFLRGNQNLWTVGLIIRKRMPGMVYNPDFNRRIKNAKLIKILGQKSFERRGFSMKNTTMTKISNRIV